MPTPALQAWTYRPSCRRQLIQRLDRIPLSAAGAPTDRTARWPPTVTEGFEPADLGWASTTYPWPAEATVGTGPAGLALDVVALGAIPCTSHWTVSELVVLVQSNAFIVGAWPPMVMGETTGAGSCPIRREPAEMAGAGGILQEVPELEPPPESTLMTTAMTTTAAKKATDMTRRRRSARAVWPAPMRVVGS